MAISGHISAHSEQPVHFSESEKNAMVTPRLFGVSLKETNFFGQAMVQSPHPLQRDSLTMIYGIVMRPFIEFDVYSLADSTCIRQAPEQFTYLLQLHVTIFLKQKRQGG